MSSISENEQRRQETGGHIAGIFSSSETLLDADGGTERRETIHLRIYKTILKSGMLAELKGAPLSVLLAIALYANGEGKAWPSARTLAENTGYHRQTVKKALSKLEELDWIERRQQRLEDGTWGRRIFTIKHPKAPPDGESDRGIKNRRRFNRRRLNHPKVLSSSEEVSKGEGGNRGGSGPEQPSPAKSETAVTIDDEDDSPSPLREILQQIKPHLTVNGEPQEKHLEILRDLLQKHGVKNLRKILTYAFDEFFPQDSWMKDRPRTWGTVTHCLPDAAAVWERGQVDYTPIFEWSCPDCGEQNTGSETRLSGRRGLLCGRCGTGVDTEQGREVAKCQPSSNEQSGTGGKR